MTIKTKPCPPTGPAHDGRGGGTGMPGGSRRGRRSPNKTTKPKK